MAVNNDYRTPEQREADRKRFAEEREKFLSETVTVQGTQNGVPCTIVLSRREVDKLITFSSSFQEVLHENRMQALRNAVF